MSKRYGSALTDFPNLTVPTNLKIESFELKIIFESKTLKTKMETFRGI